MKYLFLLLLSLPSFTFAQNCVKGTWTGNTNTDWFNSQNWCEEEVPSDTSSVVIAAGSPFYPVISGKVTIKNLLLEAGASLTIQSDTLFIRMKLDIYGSLSLHTGAFLKVLDQSSSSEPTDVYTAGYNNGKIVYWKNGEEKLLDSADFAFGATFGIAVSDTDIYVAGNYNYKATYWKNGVRTPLYTGIEGSSDARAIAVDGSDVYITGVEVFNNTGQRAFLWKNGVTTILSPTLIAGIGTGIALAGGDVYVSGSLTAKAVYWKNGEAHFLSTDQSEATAISVAGKDVYVAGREGWQAVYWKNGVKTILTPYTSGIAYGVFVSGSDVYVVGKADGQATVWKNDIATPLDPSYSATARAITSDGKDIYIAGAIATTSTTTCVYWQNGIKKELATLRNYPPEYGFVSAITVVSH